MAALRPKMQKSLNAFPEGLKAFTKIPGEPLCAASCGRRILMRIERHAPEK